MADLALLCFMFNLHKEDPIPKSTISRPSGSDIIFSILFWHKDTERKNWDFLNKIIVKTKLKLTSAHLRGHFLTSVQPENHLCSKESPLSIFIYLTLSRTTSVNIFEFISKRIISNYNDNANYFGSVNGKIQHLCFPTMLFVRSFWFCF